MKKNWKENYYENYLNTFKSKGYMGELNSFGKKAYSYLVKRMWKKIPTEKVNFLDWGCGVAHIVDFLPPQVEYVGMDVSKDLEIAKKRHPNKKFIKKDILKNGNSSDLNSKFDIVFSSHVYEHLPNIDAATQALEKCLKPNGYFIITCPNEGTLIRKIASMISPLIINRFVLRAMSILVSPFYKPKNSFQKIIFDSILKPGVFSRKYLEKKYNKDAVRKAINSGFIQEKKTIVPNYELIRHFFKVSFRRGHIQRHTINSLKKHSLEPIDSFTLDFDTFLISKSTIQFKFSAKHENVMRIPFLWQLGKIPLFGSNLCIIAQKKPNSH